MRSPDEILSGLDREQREAVTAPRAPLIIVAGAGTGKTRTITHRIAYRAATGELDPSKVHAVTHSAKAAGEMRDRLLHLGARRATTRTFHATALALLRQCWARTGRDHDLSVLNNRYGLVRSALEGVDGRRSQGRDGRKSPSSDAVFDVASEIAWAKASLVTPSGYAAAALRSGRLLPAEPEIIEKVYERYEELRERQGALDFEDLLTVATDVLTTDDSVAQMAHARYQTFVVDEFQDTDRAQQRLLDALVGESRDICVVGDPRQSIYTFKGADPSVLERFTECHTDAIVVTLVRDYRSTPEVVLAANCLIPAGPSEALVGQRSNGPRPRILAVYDEAAEERAVVREIRRLADGATPLKQIAVLYRFNAQSARFEAALTAAGIPYSVADDERFFERREIRQPLVAFEKAVGTNASAPGVALLEGVLHDHGFDPDHPPAGAGAIRGRFDAQMALVEMVEALPNARNLVARELLDELSRRAAEAHSPTPDGVALSTLHRAKGLEYDAVFLVGLVEGSVPSSYATDPGAVEEERRLLYVGITRARQHLFLSWASHRAGSGGASWSSKPSRFLDDLELATRSPRSGRTAAPKERSARHRDGPRPPRALDAGSKELLPIGGCTTCRGRLRGLAARRLGRCGPECLVGADATLYRALWEWREAATSGASDRALFALVAHRPTTKDELAKIAGLDKASLQGSSPELLDLCARHPRDE